MRTNNVNFETEIRDRLSTQIVFYSSDYPMIASQSKVFLMEVIRTIQHLSESDYWSDLTQTIRKLTTR